jgi:hypothetical protein
MLRNRSVGRTTDEGILVWSQLGKEYARVSVFATPHTVTCSMLFQDPNTAEEDAKQQGMLANQPDNVVLYEIT